MEIKSRSCLYCGQVFEPIRNNHRFCSRRCSHYYHNRIGNQHKTTDNMYVIREFLCKECSKHVMISDTKDKRTDFCSAQCSRNYYRHGHEHRCTNNQGLSGGMSLGSLKRREAWMLEK